MTANDAPPLAGRREWLGLAVLALPTMLAMMDINILILALPHISADLGASSTQQLWITDIYGFLIAGFLVTMGTLGDRIGRRKVLLTGAAAFTALSVIAAFSTSPEMLIIVRALLGVAGATIMPSTLALIMNMFPNPKQMGAAIGVWATAMMAGIAAGPAIGGLLLNSFWWGSAFLVAVPIMLLLIATGPALLPEFRTPEAGKLDLASVALSLGAIIAVIYGLKELVNSGWSATAVIVPVLGIALGVWFVRRQRQLDSPLLDLRLFSIPAVAGALMVGLLFAAIQGGTGLMVTMHLQLVEAFSPLRAALWLLIPAAVMIIGIQLTTPLSRKFKPAAILVTGMVIAALGMVVLIQVDMVGGLAMLVIGSSIVFLGGSPIGVLVNQLVMTSAPPEKAGSAASLNSTGGELGVALGIAGIGTLGAGVYQANVEVPAGLSDAAAGAAQESLAGATAVAAQQPAAVGDELLTTAREAFTTALNTTAGICAVAFVGMALLAYGTLRRIPVPGPPPGAPPQEEPPQEEPPQEEGVVESKNAEVAT